MFIKSTLSVGAWVTFYAPPVAGKNTLTVEKRILIKGGANVQDRRSLVAVDGIIQEISDADYEILKDHPWFKRQVEAGFIIPMKSKPKEKFEDMETKDGSAQLDEKHFKKSGRKAPKAVSASDDDADL